MQYETLYACDICASHDLDNIDKNNCICKCLRCGYVFDNPRPVQAEIIQYYSQADKYNSWIEDEYARDLLWMRRLFKMEGHLKPGSLLDVGTGIGQFMHHAKKYFTEVYGTEISKSAISIAKKKYNLDVFEGALEAVNFSGVKFDNITLFHVLEHVRSPKSVIDLCGSLLESDGVLFIAVPNDDLLIETKLSRIVRYLGIDALRMQGSLLPKISLDGGMQEIHLSHFTPSVLRYLLAQSGFTIVDESLDPSYALVGLKKLLADLRYLLHLSFMAVLGRNCYSTIWIAAKKVI